MKAHIDDTGKLSILPEGDTEEFALIKWWESYILGGSASLQVLVREQAIEEASDKRNQPGTTTDGQGAQ